MSETLPHRCKRNLPSGPNRVYCCVFGCLKNTNTNPDLSFFSVPKDPQKRKQWLQIISREDLIERNKSCRVCEVHFQQDDIMKSRRKVLKRCALPLLHLPCQTMGHKETQTHVKVYNISTQTDDIASVMIKMENVTMNNISYEAEQIERVEIKIEENNLLCQTERLDSADIKNEINNVSCQTEQIRSVKIRNEMNNITSQTDQTMSFALGNTTETASITTDTPQKRKLKSYCLGCPKRLNNLKTGKTRIKSQDLRQFNRLCDRFLPNKLAKLVKAQANSESNRRKRIS